MARTLHERIRSDIEARILSGATSPGEKIPSEQELMKTYRCSRMTVNKAMTVLNNAGLVRRRKRAGTVVAERRTEAMVLDVPDLAGEISNRGQTYRYALIERLIRKPVRGHGDEERLARTGELLVVRGVHSADGQPLAYEERLVSLDAVPEIAREGFTQEAPGSWLLRHIPWTEAEHRIGATPAAIAWAALLDIPVGGACLTVERRTWRAGEHITMVRQHFVAGRYELIARFGPTPKPA